MLDIGPAARLAISTDSYVVRPLFFPGGNIGDLAVNGTVNDLAMSGARRLPVCRLHPRGRLHRRPRRGSPDMGAAAGAAGVPLVTGDTKVVERGPRPTASTSTPPGSASSPLAWTRPRAGAARRRRDRQRPDRRPRHGRHVVREGLEFGTEISSDTAPLNGLVAAMLGACRRLHVLRDPTRGGLAASLNEIADAARVGMESTKRAARPRRGRGGLRDPRPRPALRGQRGQARRVRPAADADDVLAAMRAHELGRERMRHRPCGRRPPRMVVARTASGDPRARPAARGAAPADLLNQGGSSGLGLLAPGAFRRTDQHGVGALAVALPGIRVGADRHHVAIVPSRDAERRELLR